MARGRDLITLCERVRWEEEEVGYWHQNKKRRLTGVSTIFADESKSKNRAMTGPECGIVKLEAKLFASEKGKIIITYEEGLKGDCLGAEFSCGREGGKRNRGMVRRLLVGNLRILGGGNGAVFQGRYGKVY